MSDVAPTMTVPELAARMGIDQSTAWRYLRDGKLPGVQVASRWLIDRERVERFLSGKEDAAGNPLVADESPSLADASTGARAACWRSPIRGEARGMAAWTDGSAGAAFDDG